MAKYERVNSPIQIGSLELSNRFRYLDNLFKMMSVSLLKELQKVYTAVVFILAGLFSILLLIVTLMPVLNSCKSTDEQLIKVGILHSLSGTMAISEKSVADATLLAIEEIDYAEYNPIDKEHFYA